MYGLGAFFSRVFYNLLSFDIVILHFLAGITATPMIFYLLVSINKNIHTTKNLLGLIIGIMFLQYFIEDTFDNNYYALNLGVLLSVLFIRITFTAKINNWLSK